MVPVPKKGNLSSCVNWRGISLLDVVGKVFTKIIQQRLQAIVEELIFGCNRGCTDMIFCAWKKLLNIIPKHLSCLWISERLMILFP